MALKQYKAFDFKTGNTYLIGEFESKAAAKGYCETNGIVTIAQTLVALTECEYQVAYRNRKPTTQDFSKPKEDKEMGNIEEKIKQHIVEELSTADRESLMACRVFIRTCREAELINREQKITLLNFANAIFEKSKERRATA